MVLPDIPSTIFEGEAELAVVIGKPASNVPAAKAMEYVFGYVNFIDGSARGVQPAQNSFYQMKSRASFAPIGPYLVTADEIPDPHKLQVRLWVNGQLKQNFNTDDMAHKIPRCIEWVTSIHDSSRANPRDGTTSRGLSAFMDNRPDRAGKSPALAVDGQGEGRPESAPGRASAPRPRAEGTGRHHAAADRQVRQGHTAEAPTTRADAGIHAEPLRGRVARIAAAGHCRTGQRSGSGRQRADGGLVLSTK
jgi:hypothetical protein